MGIELYHLVSLMTIAVDASPLPALSESYSTTVEWKLLHNNSTISIEEYVIGMEKLSSIRITQEGHTSRIIYDEIAQQYTTIDVVNSKFGNTILTME